MGTLILCNKMVFFQWSPICRRTIGSEFHTVGPSMWNVRLYSMLVYSTPWPDGRSNTPESRQTMNVFEHQNSRLEYDPLLNWQLKWKSCNTDVCGHTSVVSVNARPLLYGTVLYSDVNKDFTFKAIPRTYVAGQQYLSLCFLYRFISNTFIVIIYHSSFYQMVRAASQSHSTVPSP